MDMGKRIIALFSVFAIALSCAIVPAHADTEYTSGNSFSQWLISQSDSNLYRTVMNYLLFGTGCPENTDGKHRGKFKIDNIVTDTTSQWFGHYFATCDSCGAIFYGSPSEVDSAVSDAYNSYVDELPVNGIDSSGGFIWYPTTMDIPFTGSSNSGIIYYADWDGFYFKADSFDTEITSGSYYKAIFTDSTTGFNVNISHTGNGHSGIDQQGIRFNLYAPLSGTYYRNECPAETGSCTDKDGSTWSFSDNYNSSNVGHVAQSGYIAVVFASADRGDSRFIVSASVDCYLPSFTVVPDSESMLDSSIYSVDTRPASINGKYIVPNGDAYEDSSTTIVNENDNSIYNPVTGDTTTYESWTYDYSTRTYTMTDNTNNSTSTVTYGDENITINEGGNTYNIYYGTVNNNSGDSGEGSGSSGNSDTGIDLPSNDGISTLGNKLKEFFVAIPEMIGDLNNFLTDAFPYIPEEMMYLIEFSLSLSVLMGIIKMIRG